jgi:predicted XRE-type DNA-binding protein
MIVVERGSANVYSDLNADDADVMLIKAQLARKISALMKIRQLTQIEAEQLFGMKQPKISGMLRGQFRGISEEKMMRCLVSLGQNVEIVVKPAKRGQMACISVAA